MNPISFSLFKPGPIVPNVSTIRYNYFGNIIPNLITDNVTFMAYSNSFDMATYQNETQIKHVVTDDNYASFDALSEPNILDDEFQKLYFGYNNPNIVALGTSNPKTGGTTKYVGFTTEHSYLEGISVTTDLINWSQPVKFSTPNFTTVYSYSANPPTSFQSITGYETAKSIGIASAVVTDQYALVIPYTQASKNYWMQQYNPQTQTQSYTRVDTIGGLAGQGAGGVAPIYKTTDGVNYSYIRSSYTTSLSVFININSKAFPLDMTINNIPNYNGNYSDKENNIYPGRNAQISEILFEKPGAAINLTLTDAGAGLNHPQYGNNFQMYCYVPAPAGTGSLPIYYQIYVQNGTAVIFPGQSAIQMPGAGFTSNIVNQEVQLDLAGELNSWMMGTYNQTMINQYKMQGVTYTRLPKVTITVNTNYAMIKAINWKDGGDGYTGAWPTIAQSNTTHNRNFTAQISGLGNITWSSVSQGISNRSENGVSYATTQAFPNNVYESYGGQDSFSMIFSPNNKGDVLVIPQPSGGIVYNDVYGTRPTRGLTNSRNRQVLDGSIIICDSNLTNVTVLKHPSVTYQVKPPYAYEDMQQSIKPNTSYFVNSAIPESEAHIGNAYSYTISGSRGSQSTGVGNNLYVSIIKTYGSYNETDETLSEYKYKFEVWHLEIGDNVFVDKTDVVWTKMFESSEFTSNKMIGFGFGGTGCTLSLDAKIGAGQRATEMLATFNISHYDQMTREQTIIANETKAFTLIDEKTAVEIPNPTWTTHMQYDEVNDRYAVFLQINSQNRSALSLPNMPSQDGRYIMLLGSGERMTTGSQTVTWVNGSTHLDPFLK